MTLRSLVSCPTIGMSGRHGGRLNNMQQINVRFREVAALISVDHRFRHRHRIGSFSSHQQLTALCCDGAGGDGHAHKIHRDA